MFRAEQIVDITTFGLADSLRPGKNRIPGMCQTLLNTAPNLYGGEAIRRGYGRYVSGTALTDMKILKLAPLQRPAQIDEAVEFATSGIYIRPWYDRAHAPQTTDLLLAKNFAFTPTTGTPTPPAAITNFLTIIGTDAFPTPLSHVTDSYKGWLMKNVTRNNSALIIGNTYTNILGGQVVFTFIESVDGLLNWHAETGTLDSFIMYPYIHGNLGLVPTFNNDLANPVNVRADASFIRLSGGQSSIPANRPLWVDLNMTRTFFPNVTGKSFSILGTYADERELKTPNFLGTGMTFGGGGSSVFTANSTYWVATAAVYDGFQVSPLKIGGNIFLTTGVGIGSLAYPQAGLTTAFNKRITDILIFIARDDGDTSAQLTPNNPFQLVQQFSLINANDTGWTFNSSSGGSLMTYQYLGGTSHSYGIVTEAAYIARGSTFEGGAGYASGTTETMYAYSGEEVISGRHYIFNSYVTSEVAVEKQKYFTNPIGGFAGINAGLIQPDLFPNEDGIYRKDPQPTIGTRITGILSTGIDEVLIVKDRGILLGRGVVAPDGTLDFLINVISTEAGCSSFNQLARADDGWIYFAGYDDIYRYRQGEYMPLIQHGEKNDWLRTYLEVITKTQKESLVTFFLPEGVVYFDGQADGLQLAYYAPRLLGDGKTGNFGWRQAAFKQSGSFVSNQFFKWITRLQNGTVIATTSDATPEFKEFSNDTTGAFFYTDDYNGSTGTAIAPQIDTGEFIFKDGFDLHFEKYLLSKVIDVTTQGTLDCKHYLDGVLIKTYSGMSKSFTMLHLNHMVGLRMIGHTLRFVYNTHTADAERTNGGVDWQLHSIGIYGDLVPHTQRKTEIQARPPDDTDNEGTILGVCEFLIPTKNTDTQFTFDTAFTGTYTSIYLGAGKPKWRMFFHSAKSGTGTDIDFEQVILTSETLAGFKARSPEDNTLVKYKVVVS